MCLVAFVGDVCAQALYSLGMKFSHHGKRKRGDVLPLCGHPGYSLFRLRDGRGRLKVRKILPKAADPNRAPFLVEYEIRRKLRGRGGGWGKALSMSPKKDKDKRWDLRLPLGRGRCAYYHRLVGLSVCPCTTDAEGAEVEPYFVEPSRAKRYEVHHGRPKDTHDCRCGNLFVLLKEHHRELARGSYLS